jgi:hypothetical protein
MSVRITTKNEAGQSVVRVEGHLRSDSVLALKEECRGAGGHLRLELSSLISADEAGVHLLRQLASEGSELRGASPYLQLLMDLEHKPNSSEHNNGVAPRTSSWRYGPSY